MPLITLSITSHGDVPKVCALLESILRHERQTDYQIIITDNLGDDEFSAPVFQSATILRNQTRQGFAANHNAAFKHARGEYFCVLNPDILFIQPVFNLLIENIQHRQADILAPLIVDGQGETQDSFRSLPTPAELISRRLRKEYSRPMPAARLSPDWLAGMFLFMRTDTFQNLDGFDERYYLYFEDVDFSTRARLAGYRLLLDPSLQVQHDAHRASEKRLRYLRWHVQSAIRFFRSQVYKDIKKMG